METKQKTWKREVALGMLVFLGTFYVTSVFSPAALSVAEMMQWPLMAFVTAAFGLDAIAKQL